MKTYTRYAPSELRARIATLMADGRERTVDDILHQIPQPPSKLKNALGRLVQMGILESGGLHHIRIYWRAGK